MTNTHLLRRGLRKLRMEGVIQLLGSVKTNFSKKMKNYWYYINIKIRYFKNRYRYGTAVAPPFELISVNPHDIKLDQLDCGPTDWNNREMKRQKVAAKHGQAIADEVSEWYHPDAGRFRRKENHGKILDGDWDNHTKQWNQRRVYRSIKQVYDNGADWRDTPIFQKRMAIYELTGSAYGYDVEDPITKRINYIEDLYENIVQHGFLTQSEAPDDYRNKDIFHNITINIGRNGELIFNHAGQHRLAFAKYLDIDKIPVLVIVRHKKWQEVRNRMSRADTKDDLDPELRRYYEHPDLIDVRPD